MDIRDGGNAIRRLSVTAGATLSMARAVKVVGRQRSESMVAVTEQWDET